MMRVKPPSVWLISISVNYTKKST